jgi:hypothetical protein
MDALSSMGLWRGFEGAIEITVPITIVGGAWFAAYSFLGAPTPGMPMTYLEVMVLLSACVAVTAWMSSRQLHMMGRRGPWQAVIMAWIYSGVILFILPRLVRGSFKSSCKAVEGELVLGVPLSGPDSFQAVEAVDSLCRIQGVADNPYLPGILFRPSWDGSMGPLMVVVLVVVAGVVSLGLRDVRVRPTRMAFNIVEKLRHAASMGGKSAIGPEKVKDGRIQACANATMWGEVCGQIYSADKEFSPGEWCPRCRQAFTPGTREQTFKVVTLFTGDIELLNGLERTDTVSWPRGDPMPPDARISGAERWVTLGAITVPDVISVAQLLALVHEQLAVWAGSDNEPIAHAAELAKRRASKISAWIWAGSLAHRLTYARPNTVASLALGASRLRNLIPDGGDELWLQLDIGLFPLEVRTGFRKPTEDGRIIAENSKVDLWIPIAPSAAKKGEQGVWVPRVEGDALRMWLSMDRLRQSADVLATQPLPYYRFIPNDDDPPPTNLPQKGSLDYVRFSVKEGSEPSREEAVGTSIVGWEWLEPEQIQLLRQECLVLVEGR